MLRYLMLRRALLFSFILFLANRAWNYYDKMTDNGMDAQAIAKYSFPFSLTIALCCFFLGIIVVLELNSVRKDIRKKQ